MKSVNFTVVGIMGKQRPRFSNGHAYTPSETVSYEKQVKHKYLDAANGTKFEIDIPLRIDILVRYSIPDSYTKEKKQRILDHLLLPTKKPDIDNIAKIIMDGLNGIAYYDDKQVIELNVKKTYSQFGDNVQVWVTDASR